MVKWPSTQSATIVAPGTEAHSISHLILNHGCMLSAQQVTLSPRIQRPLTWLNIQPTVSPLIVSAQLLLIHLKGKFTMNMTQATGPGGVPTASLITSGVALEGKQLIKDGDNLSLTHGYAMAALVLVFTPILALHLLTGARLRWMNYTLFTLVAVVGLVCGFYDSMSYNRVCF